MGEPSLDFELQKVVIGGLLHDIGKLIQRAEQDYQHNHSHIGYDFIKGIFKFDGMDEILEIIKYHHQKELESAGLKSNNIAYIVCEADNIASGADRRGTEETPDKNKKSGFDKMMPLQSIFSTINVKNKDNTKKFHYLRRLKTTDENSDTPFNYPVPEGSVFATKAKYQEIRNHLKNSLSGTFTSVSRENANAILQILESDGCFIPSSTNVGEIPDISLFDHLKITASVAGCLYLYIKEKKRSEDFQHWCSSNKRKEKFYILVSADMSGIQDFIYTVASKGALKSLRTRSFYLDILLEHIADEILENLGLSRANLLYTGGGHFYMLLPNTERTAALLERVETKANDWFLEKFGTALYISIAQTECSSLELMDKENGVTPVFERLAEKLSRKKLCRYSKTQLEKILLPDSDYNKNSDNSRECSSCRNSRLPLQKSLYSDEEGDERCYNCQGFLKAGKRLLCENSIFAIVHQYVDADCSLELPSIDDDKRYLVFTNKDIIKNSNLRYKRLYTKNIPSKGAINLWMGDYNLRSEEDPDDLISFEELEKRCQGIKRIAVMRADVDDLGKLFRTAFKKSDTDSQKSQKNKTDPKTGVSPNATLSRYTTLSRQLSMFFKWFINCVCEGKTQGEGQDNNPEPFRLSPDSPTGKKNMVIVYSGGDDLFVAGAWNEVVEFAVNLRRVFSWFTCDKLTFSAGIGFFNHSFPVYQMANLTGKLEEMAKDLGSPAKNGERAKDQREKDAIALFGQGRIAGDKKSPSTEEKHVYHWDEFEKEVYEDKIKYFLHHFTIAEKERGKISISKAFLYRLLTLLRAESDTSCINLARLAYTLSRLEKSDSDHKEKDKFKDLKQTVYNWASNPKDRQQLLTALNILIYMYREDKNNQEEDMYV